MNHEAVSALVPGQPIDKEALRNLLVGRYAYTLRSIEVVPDADLDLEALDPDFGALIPALIYEGKVYGLDPTDTTTEHDGESCLVSSDGYRYKLDDLRIPTSVLDKDRTTPPASPTIGNAYLIFGAPSGGWASFTAGDVVIYTARGWIGVTLGVGRLIYVVDEEGIYHRKSNGTWSPGFGINSVPDDSVKVSQLIGGGDLIHFIVENQSTNDPPSSPAKGDTYIIGNSPTGSWLGNAGKIARCENLSGTFTIYTPKEGWRVYDKALDADYRFNGTAWDSQRGAMVYSQTKARNNASTLSLAGSGVYTYHATTPPNATHLHFQEETQLNIVRTSVAGRLLEFTYEHDNLSESNGARAIGLCIDSVSACVDYLMIISGQVVLRWTAADNLEHTFFVRWFRLSGSALTMTQTRRRFTLREYA